MEAIPASQGTTPYVQSRFLPRIIPPLSEKQASTDVLRWLRIESGLVDNPSVLLIHGFPSQAYSYRKAIPVLSEAYRAVFLMQSPESRDSSFEIISVCSFFQASFSRTSLNRDMGSTTHWMSTFQPSSLSWTDLR